MLSEDFLTKNKEYLDFLIADTAILFLYAVMGFIVLGGLVWLIIP